jgi:chromosome partitioning protein
MTIAFANHKGGTGKTTSVINIGRALVKNGKKVLLIDLDPQGNLTYSLGVSVKKPTVADFLTGENTFEETACEVFEMHLLPANGNLYQSAKTIEALPNPQFLLNEKLRMIADNYHYILIDCPPSLSVYTLNALYAAHGVIIPLIFEILSIQGLDQILSEVNRVRKTGNPGLEIIGALGVIVNENRKLSEEVLQYIRDNYRINVFNNHVRNNVKAAEAPSFGESVLDYAPGSISAKDYLNVTSELLKILETSKEII